MAMATETGTAEDSDASTTRTLPATAPGRMRIAGAHARHATEGGFGRCDGREGRGFEQVESRGAEGPFPRSKSVGDRVKVGRALEPPHHDSVETSLPRGRWRRVRDLLHEERRQRTGGVLERFECRTCGIGYETPQQRLFSFNNRSAVSTCNGFGNVIELDMQLVVPDASKSLTGGAVEPGASALPLALAE